MYLRDNQGRKRNGTTSRGFTLIELLVAAAITAVLGLALVTIASNATTIWRSSTGNMSADNRAVLILNQIERDLSGIIFDQQDITRVFDVRVRVGAAPSWEFAQGVRGGLRPTNVASRDLTSNPPFLRRFQSGVHLTFLARSQDADYPIAMGMPTWSPPNLSTFISYQIVRDEQNFSDAGTDLYATRYNLYRSVIRPGPADINLASVDPSDNVYDIGPDLSLPIYSPTSRPSNADPFSPGRIEYPHPTMLLAENVVDFGIVFYDANGTELFPVGEENMSNLVSQADNGNYPAFAMVVIRLLTEEGARLLSGVEVRNVGLDTRWWDIVERHSRVYTRMVMIRPQML